jgi:hypothetical protein
MTKSLELKRDNPRVHPFDTTAPSISRRALDHVDLLSGDYWGELRPVGRESRKLEPGRRTAGVEPCNPRP